MYKKCKDFVKSVLPKPVWIIVKTVAKAILFCVASFYMWCLNLRQPTKITTLYTTRIGHLAINTDCFIRMQRAKHSNQRTIFIASLPIVNDFLVEKWSSIVEVITYKDKHYLFYERLRKCLAFFDSRYVFELPYSGTEYEVYQNTENVFYFTKEEKQEGDRILQEMGIGQNDWFVCIFARDSAYLDKTYGEFDEITGGKAWAHHDYRDSDIDSLNLAIDEILARGGFVVRLGKIVEKAMSYKHARVIDYPLTQWRSDFMDIYLQYRAKFVLSSSTSGATDVVSLFGTHYCGANMPANWNPPYKNSIWIPKTYSHNGTMVSFRQWIRLAEEKKAHYFYGGDYEITSTSMFSAEFYTTNQLHIIDNTPEEILDLTKEMFERLDGSFTQTDEDKKLQALYAEINDTYLPARANKNPIGRDFLRKNKWFLEN